MERPFVSLLVASAATAGGLALTSAGAAGHHVVTQTPRPDPAAGAAILTLAGVLLLGLAAASLALHWVGALVIGSVHALLGLLALVAPFGNPFAGGIFSPVFQITRMLATIDGALSEGATVFYFSGTGLVVGAFLAAAALGIRSRHLAGRSSRRAVALSSAAGALALLAAVALLLIVGKQFVVALLERMHYDAGLAGLTVVAGVLAGVAGLSLRWSSLGVIALGGIALGVGIAAFLLPVPFRFVGQMVAEHGLMMIAGATWVGAALGGLLRERTGVTDGRDAL